MVFPIALTIFLTILLNNTSASSAVALEVNEIKGQMKNGVENFQIKPCQNITLASSVYL